MRTGSSLSEDSGRLEVSINKDAAIPIGTTAPTSSFNLSPITLLHSGRANHRVTHGITHWVAHRIPTPVTEQSAVILILSLDDIKYFRGGKHAEELVVIGLLDALQLQLDLIPLLNHFLAGFLVCRLNLLLCHHLVVECTLLLLHLPEHREEGSGFPRSQTGFLGNILLHVGLEFLRRESLLPLSLSPNAQCKDNSQTINDKSLHF